jgi:hypothetical protein
MKTKIKLLTCLLFLTACSQETATAQTTAAIPAVVKKIELTKKPNSDKDMMLNSTGIDLIKFGASLQEVKKILNDKQIKTDQISDDGNTLLFASEVLNVDGIPVPRLFLRFNPKNLLSSIEFTSNADTWKTTETNAVKWSDKITELLGKPTKSSNISAELFNDVVKSTEHKSWKKNNISVKSNTNIHSAYGAKLEYDVAFLLEHAKFASKSKNTGIYVTPPSLTKAGKRIKAKYPDWDDLTCSTVGAGEIFLGMTKEQVRAAWGRPYKVNTTKTVYGTREQWVMYETGSTYVYFDDGIYTALQK